MTFRRRPSPGGPTSATIDFGDERAALVELDLALAERPIELALGEVVLPALSACGADERERATGLIRARLIDLARGWGAGQGPRALLGTVPGDPHDLWLIAFGLVLRAGGWRVTYLGPRTRLATLVETAELLSPPLVVLEASVDTLAERARGGLQELAAVSTLWLAGSAASAELAEAVGARRLGADPVSAAVALRSDTGAAAPGR